MKKKIRYSNLRLADANGEYSANPSDYFRMKPSDKFEGDVLMATEHKGEWKREKILKGDPTLKDLIRWNKRIKEFL